MAENVNSAPLTPLTTVLPLVTGALQAVVPPPAHTSTLPPPVAGVSPTVLPVASQSLNDSTGRNSLTAAALASIPAVAVCSTPVAEAVSTAASNVTAPVTLKGGKAKKGKNFAPITPTTPVDTVQVFEEATAVAAVGGAAPDTPTGPEVLTEPTKHIKKQKSKSPKPVATPEAVQPAEPITEKPVVDAANPKHEEAKIKGKKNKNLPPTPTTSMAEAPPTEQAAEAKQSAKKAKKEQKKDVPIVETTSKEPTTPVQAATPVQKAKSPPKAVAPLSLAENFPVEVDGDDGSGKKSKKNKKGNKKTMTPDLTLEAESVLKEQEPVAPLEEVVTPGDGTGKGKGKKGKQKKDQGAPNLQAKSPASTNTKSTLADEIARARQHIQNTLQQQSNRGDMGVTNATELSNQIQSLQSENSTLRNVIDALQQQMKSLELRVSAIEGGKPAAAQPAATAPKAVSESKDDDEDVDLFASDDEVDEEAERLKEERLKAYQEKKSKKPALIAKSNVVLDVKPWDDETDMKAVEAAVRAIAMPGLLWGAARLVPLAYGIKKLQISCVVEDDQVSIDLLQEEIEKNEDLVQSVDIAAFNKI